MRIGLDLDNTIICYDQAIEQLAEETLAIPPELARKKASLRDYLRAEDREDEWTEFQGRLYGPGMSYAKPFPDALNTIQDIQRAGHTTYIISHRTRYPYLGPKYDLHDSARQWIEKNLVADGEPLLERSHIHLNETRDAKIALAVDLECDVFVDDLIEVLDNDQFPVHTQKILFSPQGKPQKDLPDNVSVITSWIELQWLSQS